MTSFAIIGAGYMAREHIKALMQIKGVTIAGIMGRTPEKTAAVAEEFSIPAIATTISELHDKTAADGLIICASELAAPALINDALDYPWAILAEKPVGLFARDAMALAEKIGTHKRSFYIAMNRRHYSSTVNALEILGQDDQPRVIEVHDQENIIAAITAGVPREVVSRWMVANSIHLIDYLTLFGRGQIDRVEIIRELDLAHPFFTHKAVHFDSGDIGIYTALWNAPGPWSVRVTTQSRMLEMRPLEQLEEQLFPSKARQPVPLSGDDSICKPGLLRQASQLVDAISGNPHQLPDMTAYLKTHHLVEMLYPQSLEV